MFSALVWTSIEEVLFLWAIQQFSRIPVFDEERGGSSGKGNFVFKKNFFLKKSDLFEWNQ